MKSIKEEIRSIIFGAIGVLANRENLAVELDEDQILIEIPPRPELGDASAPMFPFAKTFRNAPNKIAESLYGLLSEAKHDFVESISVAGAYLNIKINRRAFSKEALTEVSEHADAFGCSESRRGIRIMIEYSCPNTNMPLHVGHLRNDAIGSSVSKILKATGATVEKVNLINDRGIHICKSMAAYRKFGNGETPESTGMKSDHFVGKYYVRYSSWAEADPGAESVARELLQKWESGDEDTRALWRMMNGWVTAGIEDTYKRTNIDFDRVYYESNTYTLGREEIHDGVSDGVFYSKEDGSIWVDLSDIDLDQKVLLRSDGTSVYITQDIGTAIHRHNDWPFDQMVYVVAAEQDYHFSVLFEVLKRLGYGWSKNLYHLSYGMVNLREGKMKSREGTVVDADDLLDTLESLAMQEIRDKDREHVIKDVETTTKAIALAAVHYYLLQITPKKDMVFDPVDSIAFNGNTGPYLQYTGARISSMLGKYDALDDYDGVFDPGLIDEGDGWEIVKHIATFGETIEQAARELNPTIIVTYLYALAKLYSRFYHDNPILHNEDKDLIETRVVLSRAVQQVLKNGFALIGIQFLDQM